MIDKFNMGWHARIQGGIKFPHIQEMSGHRVPIETKLSKASSLLERSLQSGQQIGPGLVAGMAHEFSRTTHGLSFEDALNHLIEIGFQDPRHKDSQEPPLSEATD